MPGTRLPNDLQHRTLHQQAEAAEAFNCPGTNVDTFVRAFSFSPDGTKLASIGSDAIAYVWDMGAFAKKVK
jgi:hypothetical protein